MKKRNFILGVTGTMGAGKSEVVKILENLGCVVFDSDKIAKDIVFLLKDEISTILGETIYDDSGILKKRMAEIIFNDSVKREAIEKLVLPKVWEEIMDQVSRLPKLKIVVVESAILFEKGGHRYCDKVLVVTADESVAIERLMKYRGFGKEDILARLKVQMPGHEKVAMADYVINNNTTLKDLESGTRGVFAKVNWRVLFSQVGFIP